MKWSVGKKIAAGFCLALVILLVVGVVSYRTTARLIETAGAVERSHQVLEYLQEILSLIKDVETAQRGYVITGAESYLVPYTAALKPVRDAFERVRRETADDPRHQGKLDELSPLLEARITVAQRTIDARTTRGFEAAQREVLTDRGEQLTDGIHQIVRAMQVHEYALLQKRDQDARTVAQRAVTTIVAGTALAVIVVALAGIARIADRIGHGDLNVEFSPNGRADEVGALMQSFLRFSVVAQEVKSLAEQSRQATAQVRTILNDIQKATSSAVLATEPGSKTGSRLSLRSFHRPNASHRGLHQDREHSNGGEHSAGRERSPAAARVGTEAESARRALQSVSASGDMAEHPDAIRRVAALQRLALFASAAVVLLPCLVLTGWALEISSLKTVLPGLVAMNPMNAVAFILAGIGLAVAVHTPNSMVTRTCGVAVGMIGALVLSGYLTGWNAGIDRLLFTRSLDHNVMAPTTAVAFLLSGLAMLLLDLGKRGRNDPAQICAVIVALMALLALTGYFYGVEQLYRVGQFIAMALHTASTFLLLAIGLLCARADRGLMQRFINKSPGGSMLRRLLPAIVVVPFALGWLIHLMFRRGALDAPLAFTVFVIGVVVYAAAMIWGNAISLDHGESQRSRAEMQLAGELAQAAAYIRSLLPAPLRGPVASDWCFQPSAQLGGDAFGYHWMDEDHLAIYLLDVCGHGVDASLLSVSVLNTLRSQSLPETDFHDPAAVLAALNRTFRAIDQNFLYFTLWFGVYRASRRELRFSSGGHPPSLLLGPNADVVTLATAGPAIGCFEDALYDNAQQTIEGGTRLLVLSDGVFEIFLEEDRVQTWDEFLAGFRSTETLAMSSAERLQQAQKLRGANALEDDFSLLEIRFS